MPYHTYIRTYVVRTYIYLAFHPCHPQPPISCLYPYPYPALHPPLSASASAPPTSFSLLPSNHSGHAARRLVQHRSWRGIPDAHQTRIPRMPYAPLLSAEDSIHHSLSILSLFPSPGPLPLHLSFPALLLRLFPFLFFFYLISHPTILAPFTLPITNTITTQHHRHPKPRLLHTSRDLELAATERRDAEHDIGAGPRREEREVPLQRAVPRELAREVEGRDGTIT